MPRNSYLPCFNKVSQTFLRPFLLLALLVALTGCPGVQYADRDEELGQVSWENMQNLNVKAKSQSGPYNASLSFRLKTPEDSFMLGAYVWSNGRINSHHPLRLDLQSSVGSSVAKLKEESDHFLLYDITNNVAIISRDPQAPLAAIGLPMPFTLGDLSLLLSGRYLDFFNGGDNTRPELEYTTVDQLSTFRIPSGARQGHLTLNARGYPVSWESDGEKAWSLTLIYQDVAALVANITPLPGPSRINLSHPDGYSLSINVKSLKKLPTPFTPAQLELRIPPAAEIREIGTETTPNQ